MPVSVGEDVESDCRKCGGIWHEIIAVEDEKITKVRCRECMTLDSYRAQRAEVQEEGSDAPTKRPRATASGLPGGARGVGRRRETLLDTDFSEALARSADQRAPRETLLDTDFSEVLARGADQRGSRETPVDQSQVREATKPEDEG